MINAVSNFLCSMWEIAGQFPDEYGGVVKEGGKFLYEKMETKLPADSANSPYNIPRDVLTLIIRHSLPSALCSVNLVCKLWYQIASENAVWQSCHLTKLFPEAPVIDEEMWDTYIDLGKYELIFEKQVRPHIKTKREYLEIKRMESAVEDGQGFTILTLPEGLSINKIIAFAAAPKQGNATVFNYVLPPIIENWGDEEIKKTVTVVITNRIFKESKWTFPLKKRALANALKCEAPGLSAVMALAIMRFISSKPDALVRLYQDRLTLCLNRIFGSNVGFGHFGLSGPCLYYYSSNDTSGVAGQRALAVQAITSLA